MNCRNATASNIIAERKILLKSKVTSRPRLIIPQPKEIDITIVSAVAHPKATEVGPLPFLQANSVSKAIMTAEAKVTKR